jgi:hypothetical protein
VYEYVLTAPRLVLDLASDPNHKNKKDFAVTARKLVTDGGPAALRILRRRPEADPNQLLGWMRLDAAQLQYETEASVSSEAPGVRGAQFTALGPGRIWLRNDEIVNAKADPNQFSLGRPCVAHLTNFDTLKYSTATNRIVAEHKGRQLLLDYFPLVNGQYARRHARAVAGHVEALLQEITKSRLELATLTATQGISYEDETDGFVGSSLTYDYGQSLVAVRGDADQPCHLNGALVDQIDLDLKTGRSKAEIVAPGIIRVQR